MYAHIALGAYLVDRFFGEFRTIRHPVVWMGDYIGWFERTFYRDDKMRGLWLTLSLLVVVLLFSLPFAWLPWFLQVPVASMFLAHRMLHDAVLEAVGKREKVAMLVSRDTQNLSESALHKALVETYAENLSDGVVAPLLYLLFFGLPGAALYKAVNTLDSMVGYKNDRYRNFGYVSAKLDDLANFIPARVTAVLMMLLYGDVRFGKLRRFAKGHASPNAGYPITAAALLLGVKLGGATPYGGKMVPKPWFGEGREEIGREDIVRLLKMRNRVDVALLLLLYLLTMNASGTIFLSR